MKHVTIEYYKTELNKYINEHSDWNGKIKRKLHKKLYNWYKEVLNGRRKLSNEEQTYFKKKGLNLNEIVSNYDETKLFPQWLEILENYLNKHYYYGIKNNIRHDKKHISEWDGTLKRNAGNYNNHNLYEWYQQIKKNKFTLTEEQKTILKSIGLKLKSNIAKRLSFDEWIEILKDYISTQSNWNGLIGTKVKKYKNRNLYGFVNSLRDKKLTNTQIQQLKNIGLKNTLTRK